MLQKEIGIDLGTVNVLVYVRGAGIVLQEPSVVALTVNESRIVAVGEEARAMLGRTPDAIEVVRPMRDGVIADYQITEAMLKHFIKKVSGNVRFFKPKVMISVPFGVTSVESRAVHEAAVAAGGAARAWTKPSSHTSAGSITSRLANPLPKRSSTAWARRYHWKKTPKWKSRA